MVDRRLRERYGRLRDHLYAYAGNRMFRSALGTDWQAVSSAGFGDPTTAIR